MGRPISLSKEDRLELLKGYNELKNAMDTLDECQDLWLSDIRNINNFICTLHNKLKFVQPQQEYHSEWVLKENNNQTK